LIGINKNGLLFLDIDTRVRSIQFESMHWTWEYS